MGNNLSSYPSIYALGHAAIDNVLNGPVIVEEKVDGSQFSFSVYDGEVTCRSKRAEVYIENPGMFSKAVKTVQDIAPLLHEGWVYRGEYLSKPKHNTLAYDRVPNGNIILFDVMVGIESYLNPQDKRNEAERLGLECVPLLFEGVIKDVEQVKKLLETESILGKCKVEGVVIKNYNQFTVEKKIAIAKFVSEDFKEMHQRGWKNANPNKADIVSEIIATYAHAGRWQKSYQHLRDEGVLQHSPRDIGMLIKETQVDILKECEDEIKEVLFKHFWKEIGRGTVRGLPEWYKNKLAEEYFEL